MKDCGMYIPSENRVEIFSIVLTCIVCIVFAICVVMCSMVAFRDTSNKNNNLNDLKIMYVNTLDKDILENKNLNLISTNNTGTVK